MSTEITQKIVGRHIRAMAKADMDAVLSDYTEDSVVYWAEGAARGLEEIRNFAQTFFDSVPEGFWKNAENLQAVFDGEVGYTLWKSAGVPVGTDTYIVRDGKIAIQTFAMHVE